MKVVQKSFEKMNTLPSAILYHQRIFSNFRNKYVTGKKLL